MCPVYFLGRPAGRCFKCVLDRFTALLGIGASGRAARLNRSCEVKRPVHLHVTGAGGDPFGYDALVSDRALRSSGSAGLFIRRRRTHRLGHPGEETTQRSSQAASCMLCASIEKRERHVTRFLSCHARGHCRARTPRPCHEKGARSEFPGQRCGHCEVRALSKSVPTIPCSKWGRASARLPWRCCIVARGACSPSSAMPTFLPFWPKPAPISTISRCSKDALRAFPGRFGQRCSAE